MIPYLSLISVVSQNFGNNQRIFFLRKEKVLGNNFFVVVGKTSFFECGT